MNEIMAYCKYIVQLYIQSGRITDDNHSAT